MSTRRAARARRARSRFLVPFAAVLGALILVSAAGSVASLVQGPRVTEVQVDPAASIEESGSRVILTANQALAGIDADLVTVEPAADFTVDAAGRTVGVRFPTPLDAATTYTVRVEGATGVGGGPAAALETTFTTPEARALVLERDADGPDEIREIGIGGEEDALVFAADEIDDFRATAGYLIVSMIDGGAARLVVVDRAGEGGGVPVPERMVDVALPGDGVVTGLQVSGRGLLYGFTFTDLDVAQGRESVLFTGHLRDAFSGGAPEPVVVAGEEPSVDRWRFVPGTTSLLLNDFDGALTLVDRGDPDADPAPFGLALGIAGVRGATYTALVERAEDGLVEIDLVTGDATPVADIDLDGAVPDRISLTPHGTLRSYLRMEGGHPAGTRVVLAEGDGVTDIADVPQGDVVLQACASPSAQYVGVAVAPDLVNNPYDGSLQPVPQRVETRIVDAGTGEQIQAIPGFAMSWCEIGPW